MPAIDFEKYKRNVAPAFHSLSADYVQALATINPRHLQQLAQDPQVSFISQVDGTSFGFRGDSTVQFVLDEWQVLWDEVLYRTAPDIIWVTGPNGDYQIANPLLGLGPAASTFFSNHGYWPSPAEVRAGLPMMGQPAVDLVAAPPIAGETPGAEIRLAGGKPGLRFGASAFAAQDVAPPKKAGKISGPVWVGAAVLGLVAIAGKRRS